MTSFEICTVWRLNGSSADNMKRDVVKTQDYEYIELIWYKSHK